MLTPAPCRICGEPTPYIVHEKHGLPLCDACVAAEGRQIRAAQPPPDPSAVTLYQGRPIAEMTREELIAALTGVARQQALAQKQHLDDLAYLGGLAPRRRP